MQIQHELIVISYQEKFWLNSTLSGFTCSCSKAPWQDSNDKMMTRQDKGVAMLSMFGLSDRTAVLEIMYCCVYVWSIQCCPVSTWCSLREAVLLPHMLPMTMGCCGNLASK